MLWEKVPGQKHRLAPSTTFPPASFALTDTLSFFFLFHSFPLSSEKEGRMRKKGGGNWAGVLEKGVKRVVGGGKWAETRRHKSNLRGLCIPPLAFFIISSIQSLRGFGAGNRRNDEEDMLFSRGG